MLYHYFLESNELILTDSSCTLILCFKNNNNNNNNNQEEEEEEEELKGNLLIGSNSVYFLFSNGNEMIKLKYSELESISVDKKKKTAAVIKRSLLLNNNQNQNLKVIECLLLKAKKYSKLDFNSYSTDTSKKDLFLFYFYFPFHKRNDLLLLKEDLQELHSVNSKQIGYMERERQLMLLLKGNMLKYLNNSSNSDDVTFDLSELEYKEVIKREFFNCKRIFPLVNTIKGRLTLTNKRIIYNSKCFKEKYYFVNVVDVLKRRYSLRNIALEITVNSATATATSTATATANRESFLLVFQSVEDRNECYDVLMGLLLLLLENSGELSPMVSPSLNLSHFTMKWLKRELSNYDYLIVCNSFADRTRLDLSQYPVFPWVLQDYASEYLDLNDSSIYRDLTKNIGSLNEDRVKTLKERYKEMGFMYGTHYSTPAYVSYYLVREKPEYLFLLQGGRFDAADRMFYSVERTWNGVSRGNYYADVKELIPEFYEPFSGDDDNDDDNNFLVNFRELDLGTRQNGKRVGDVELPAWAQNSPKKFLELMRQALESDYVSENLHHWLDLIFGYKQKGEAAVEALNVFHPLSVQGGEMDTEGMDELERRSIEVQIREFGQCPKQLWTAPHPARVSTSSSVDSLNSGKDKYAPIKKDVFESDKKNKKKEEMKMFTLEFVAICMIHRSEVTSIAVKNDHNSSVGNYSVYVGSKNGLLKVYSTRLDCAIRSFNVSSMALSSIYIVPYQERNPVMKEVKDEDTEIVVLIGSWDNNLYRFQLKNFDEKILFSFDDAVSCVLSDGHLITAGSWDGSVQLFYEDGLKPLFLRFEFDASVHCMDMKVLSDKTIYDQETMVGMEGFDGFLVVATKSNRLKLIQGTGAEKWDVEYESEAIGVIISRSGNDVVCLCTRIALCMFRLLDGVQVGKVQISAPVSAMTTVEGFYHIIVTGHEDSNIRIWDTSTGLQNGCYLIPSKTSKTKITALTAHNDLLVAGTSDGSIYTYKINAS